MWEDERAPVWRRRARAWRGFSALLGLAALTGVVLIFLLNNGWVLAGTLVLVGTTVWASGHVGVYKGRLERPARKAAQRAAKEDRRRQREAHSGS
jgi:hypothetical protein